MASAAMHGADRRERVLVTGATDGIGLVVAKEVARHGHNVIVHGRDGAKVDRVIGLILGDDAVRAAGVDVDGAVADLSDLHAVNGLATEIHRRFPDLTVLVNNAGVCMTEHKETSDGLEMTFGVNHVATTLLTQRLAPHLVAAAQHRFDAGAGTPSRVVTVSSNGHAYYPEAGRLATEGDSINWADLNSRQHFEPYTAYALSKLGNVLMTMALAQRHDPANLAFVSLSPGIVNTPLLQRALPEKVPMARTVEEGARPVIELALGTADYWKPATQSGAFCFDGEVKPPTALCTLANADRMLQQTASIVDAVLNPEPPSSPE